MIKKVFRIMAVGLSGGISTPPPTKPMFTPSQMEFIIIKLREGNYKGTEFEMFYEVIITLQEELQK